MQRNAKVQTISDKRQSVQTPWLRRKRDVLLMAGINRIFFRVQGKQIGLGQGFDDDLGGSLWRKRVGRSIEESKRPYALHERLSCGPPFFGPETGAKVHVPCSQISNLLYACECTSIRQDPVYHWSRPSDANHAQTCDTRRLPRYDDGGHVLILPSSRLRLCESLHTIDARRASLYACWTGKDMVVPPSVSMACCCWCD